MSTNSKVYNKANYSRFWGKPKQIKDRAVRNAARAKMVKEGKIKKGSSKEVDHKKGIAGGNGNGNLRIISRKTNRQDGAKKATAAKKKKESGMYYV